MIMQWLRSKWHPNDPCTDACDEPSDSQRLIQETRSSIRSRKETKRRLDEEVAKSNPADIVNVMLHARDRVSAP